MVIVQHFLDTYETRKRSFIGVFSVCVTVSLTGDNQKQDKKHGSFSCNINTLIPILRKKKFEITYVMGYHDYKNIHYVKIVRIRSYSVLYFPTFGLNTDQNNCEYGHFFRSD